MGDNSHRAYHGDSTLGNHVEQASHHSGHLHLLASSMRHQETSAFSTNDPSEADRESFYSQYAALPLPQLGQFSHFASGKLPSSTCSPRYTAEYPPPFAMEARMAALPSPNMSSAQDPFRATQASAHYAAAHNQHMASQMYMQQQLQDSPQSPPYAQGVHPVSMMPNGLRQQYHQPLAAQVYPYSMYSQQPPTPPIYQSMLYNELHPSQHHTFSPGDERFIAQAYSRQGLLNHSLRDQNRNYRDPRPRHANLRISNPAPTTSTSPNLSLGPPQKPRQSGHALWVGNLPPTTTVSELKDFFSRGATDDIESAKLIQKSNCAFVNYRSEGACVAAMSRFHDCRLGGNKLVCRLRKSVAPGGHNPSVEQPHIKGGITTARDDVVVDGEGVNTREGLRERFFVLKSLTVQDLEAAVRSGQWATQSHNEAVLSDAYEHAEAVYLFFSANKSGEYFGCAKMTSGMLSSDSKPSLIQITDDASPSTSTPVHDHTAARPTILDPGLKSTLTPATQWAPRGRIIDDTSRGTIFWEADKHEEVASPDTPASAASSSPEPPTTTHAHPPIVTSSPPTPSTSIPTPDQDQTQSQPSAAGIFAITWLSTHALPFFKTRGMRNAWNANREVKIARDGTELETEVGWGLMGLFGVDVGGGCA